jgi:DNA repair ATPase RecN
MYKPIFHSIYSGEYEDENLDCYFCEKIVNSTSLVFKDNDERNNFFDWAQQLDCVPTLGEIKSGEDEVDREKRIKDQLSQHIQKEKQRERANKVLTHDEEKDKELKKIKNMKNRLSKMNKDSKKYLKTQKRLDEMLMSYEQMFGEYELNLSSPESNM